MVGDFYFEHIKQLLDDARDDEQLFHAIVNAPFHNKIRTTKLDLGIIVLLLVNKAQGTIDRVALSDTELAAGAVKMSEKPFSEIKIPLNYPQNLIATAIQTCQVQCITDWQYLFVPALSPEAARFNQAGAGIECSCVYPLRARDGGALIFSYYQESKNIRVSHDNFMRAYSKLTDSALAREG